MQPTQRRSQDGTVESGHSRTLPPHTEKPAADQLSNMNAEQKRDKRAAVSPASPPTKLPSAKKQNAASLAAQHTEHEECHTDPLTNFPAADVPANETTLKAVLLSLQAGLNMEPRSSINHLNTRLKCLEERSDHIEFQISEMVKLHNEVINAHNDQAEMIQKLQLKVVDLEVRSLHNNIKFRGIPKSV